MVSAFLQVFILKGMQRCNHRLASKPKSRLLVLVSKTFALGKLIFAINTTYFIDFQYYNKKALKWIYETYKEWIYAMRIFGCCGAFDHSIEKKKDENI